MPVITIAANPTRISQPPTISPATRIVIATATRIGRNEGGGMWTPSGGVPAGAGSMPTVTGWPAPAGIPS